MSLIFAQTAQASWFVFEPIIGYNRGQNQVSRVQGIGLGIRTGVEYKDFFVVADIGYHDLQQGAISSVKYTDTGVTFGVSIRTFRVWYGMVSSAKYAYKSGVTDISYSGTGSKLGVGTEISGKMQLNLELRYLDYNSMDAGAGAAAVSEIATIGFLSLSWLL